MENEQFWSPGTNNYRSTSLRTTSCPTNFSLSMARVMGTKEIELLESTHDKLKFVGHLKNGQLKNVK
jgi:hypothetical protein